MKFKARVSFGESDVDKQKKDIKHLLMEAIKMLSAKDPNILREAEEYIKGGSLNASSK